MSAAVSTSRATSRTSRDKNKIAAQQTQTKTEGPKVKPTAEQLRIAQITSGQDDSDLASIHQLMEMTGKSEDAVALALHDCGHDLERAALMLLEGEDEQGEWKEQGKKKKKPNTSVPVSKSEPTSNHISDRIDNKRDHSRDVESSDRSEKHERSDHPPRRGRRNGGPPPRLARGRGRERNNFLGDRNENVENGTVRENDRDEGAFGDQKWDTFRERENGFGGGFGRERSGDRGRGRGRGKFGTRGRGRGGGPGGPPSGGGGGGGSGGGGGGFARNPQRFDKGPQIDTWTNETAAIADKEPAGFGETWTGDEHVAQEDWNDDSWQGELSETKVFTASSIKAQEQEPVSTMAMNDTSDLLGQSPSLGQRLDIGSLLPKSAESASNDSYIAQFNQQATESIKNTIGIGSSQRSNLGNLSNQTSANAMNTFSQSLSQGSRMTSQSYSQGMSTQEVLSSHGHPLQSLSSHVMSQNLSSQGMTSQGLSAQNLSSSTMQSQHLMSQGHLQQRPKSQRSKLPPPSKIPASAVEMPGHIMPQLDVQFGVDFGTESSSSFSFGSSDSVPQNNYTNSVTSSSQSSGMSNHIGQQTPSKSPESMITSSMMSSPPGSKQQQLNMDQSSPRTVFQKSAYTTPPRNENESPLNHSSKLAQPDPIPFPPSQSDRKSSPLVVSQTGAALSQVSLSSTTSESPSLGSFGQSSGSYPSTAAFQGHKSSGLAVSQSYTHPTSSHSQPSSFQSQYQTSQNQYQSGQREFPSGQSQFPSGSNQYQNYGPSGASFQSQSSYSSSQSNPNTLYQSSVPTSTYQSQTGSSFVRDSQSASSQRPSSTGASASYSSQTSSSSFQNATNPSFPSQANSSSYVHQSNGTPFSNQTASSAYTNQSASSYTNQSGSASYPNQTSGSFSNQSSGSYSNQPSSSSYQDSSLSTQSATQSQTGFNSQSFVSSGHQSTLQTSPMTGNKISDSLSKMTLKDSIPDSQTSQFDHSTSSSTSTSVTSTTATSSLSTGTTTVSSTVTSALSSTSRSSLPSTTKAPPNLPPGVPLIGAHQYIMNQGSLPPFFNLQQPLYNYEDLLLQQQRLPPLANSYYDMSAFPVPSTIAGRDQPTLASVPYSVGTTDSSKLNRVEAQSPNPTSQQQSTHSGQQPFINLHYGYYYPSMMPGGAPGFQYPQMYPMPPVTNAPHAGTTATTQFQKTYASHAYNTAKGYEDLTQAPDFSKSPYAISGTQSKATAGTRTATAADLTGTYGKSHAQPFDKQAFHAGTPPPFNLPLASATQAGAMGAATYGAPYVPMMPHQPHSQMLHHALQQDSTGASSRVSQQATSQAKVAAKPYASYGWSS
ncbi:protein lingerer-like isoform X2 [Gigantopelta aegis]|uniref:protein lingerer-like isoform X2 n=1 Tax=Gigantopelta aegis TaxID=1735272 RepID=UPI001B8891EB|nr:protein lingerer-like isoform X2 [Gigantopelta aegis]